MLSAAVLGGLRAQAALQSGRFLESLGLQASPAYLAASGLVWGAAGLLTAVGLWQGRPWVSRGAVGAAALLAVTYWADRLFFGEGFLGGPNGPFALALTLFGVGYTWLVVQSPRQQAYFQSRREAAARR